MNNTIDESEQEHIYICLKEGEKSFLKARKSSESLGLSTKPIDEALEVNKRLRLIFNPKAEEEARAAARKAKGDPTQMDIEEPPRSSGESGRVAGTIAHVGDEIPPTDTTIRDNLIACGVRVLLTDIRSWTSSQRESVVLFARDFDRFEPNSAVIMPDVLERVMITDERMEQLNRMGPYKLKGFPLGSDEPTSTLVYLPGSPGEAELIQGEYVDAQEAEIKCALLNRGVLRETPMSADIISAWFGAGPWSAFGDEVKTDVPDGERVTRWYVLGPEGIKERADTQTEAMLVAAVYNREAAGREASGEFKAPPTRLALVEDRENNEGDLRAPDGDASSAGTEGVGG